MIDYINDKIIFKHLKSAGKYVIFANHTISACLVNSFLFKNELHRHQIKIFAGKFFFTKTKQRPRYLNAISKMIVRHKYNY